MEKVVLRVPATTANMGPGFDCVGCALSLYNTVSFEKHDGILIDGCPEEFRTPDNLTIVAFKKAMEEGGVQLLEPIGHLTVTVPSDLMGDITGDINKRRGRVLGMNPGEKYLVVEADVPMSEMHKYTTDLRSMTQGRGKFEFEFVRYEIAPKEVEQKVVADANK